MRRTHSQRRMLRGPAALLRRGLAMLLVLLFAILLTPGADAHEHEDQHHTHPPICSLFCLDECTTAALPQVPAPPPPDGLPKSDYAPEPVPETLSRTVEPEHTPPRA